ncbi:MAG TPA: ribonuclease Y [bacterium]|nr:ribonuclease Y [bacterium]
MEFILMGLLISVLVGGYAFYSSRLRPFGRGPKSIKPEANKKDVEGDKDFNPSDACSSENHVVDRKSLDQDQTQTQAQAQVSPQPDTSPMQNQPQVPTQSPVSSHPDMVTSKIEEHQLVREAKNRAKEILLEAKDKALQITNEATEKASQIREQITESEKNLAVMEARIEAQREELKEKADSVNATKEAIEKKKEELDQVLDSQKRKLQEVSSLTREEAREILLARFDKDLQEEKAKRIRQLEEDIKRTADEKAKEILLDALSHGTTDYVVEHTTAKVHLPDAEMKGRIIGKEGRNITTFEKLTGVELDLDSSPGDIIISCFDPVRREIGRVALERLLADGRIQPVRIEELVQETQKDMEHIIYKEGDKLCHMLGVYDLPKDIVSLLGKFKYRFSYGQNLIKHTLEVTNIGMVLAREIGANVETVKIGCLLHDIGKVLSPDGKGSHVDHGIEYLQGKGISEEVLVCIREHHGDKFSSIESALVALADHISGARPGARSEDYESFSKRMKDLEEAALSFDGVEKAYAISAGREVRVFVEPKIVDDASTALLAREIARKIELEQSYPGVVNVTVIRETRISETAR